MANTTSLTFALFDIPSSLDVPFGIPQYIKCMHHGLTFVFLCVSFLSVTAKGVNQGSMIHGFPFVLLISFCLNSSVHNTSSVLMFEV